MINELKKEFISKFTVWNDKQRFATLEGVEEYPTPEMIADWWIKKFKYLCKTLNNMEEISNCCHALVEIGGDDTEGTHYYICKRCGKACDLEPDN